MYYHSRKANIVVDALNLKNKARVDEPVECSRILFLCCQQTPHMNKKDAQSPFSLQSILCHIKFLDL